MAVKRFKRQGRALAAFLLVVAGAAVRAQSDRLDAELRRIFQTRDYAAQAFGPAVWLDGGSAYVVVETADKTSALAADHDTATGRRDVLVDSAMLTPPGPGTPLAIEGYEFSRDRKSVLIFTSTKKVWRRNTRGDYWVLNRETRTLRKIGQDAPESSLMFAKFSPDGLSVAYVRDRNLYVEKASSGEALRLTSDETDTIVNGTSDWVNEEELGYPRRLPLEPGRQIDRVLAVRYRGCGTLLAGQRHGRDVSVRPAVRVSEGGHRQLRRAHRCRRRHRRPDAMDDHARRPAQYLSGEPGVDERRQRLLIQQLNRLQNTNDLLSADARTGEVRRVFRDTNAAWVDVVDDVDEIAGGSARVAQRARRLATPVSRGARRVRRAPRDDIRRRRHRYRGRRRARTAGCTSSHRRSRRSNDFCIAPSSMAAVRSSASRPQANAARTATRSRRTAGGRFTRRRGRTCLRESISSACPSTAACGCSRTTPTRSSAWPRPVGAPTEFLRLDIGGGVVLDASVVKPRRSIRRGSTR